MSSDFQVTFDALDPRALSIFWRDALGYVHPGPPGVELADGQDPLAAWDRFLAESGVPEDRRNLASALVDPDEVRPRIFFQQVPEAKSTKNRLHLDVNSGHASADPRTGVRRHANQLVSAGARILREMDEPTGWWLVMQDPEGNEFCLQ